MDTLIQLLSVCRLALITLFLHFSSTAISGIVISLLTRDNIGSVYLELLARTFVEVFFAVIILFLYNKKYTNNIYQQISIVNINKCINVSAIATGFFLFNIFVMWVLCIQKSISINQEMNVIDFFIFMVRSIVLGLRGSLLEEIIYRGFLQKKLMSYSYRLNSIIVSSLVFSTSHLIGIQSFTEGLWTFVDVFLFSVVVGTIFIKYNSFVYSFAFHWIWNLFISMHWVYGDCNLPKKDYLFRTYIYCDNYLSNFEFLKQVPITYILTSFAFLFILNKNLRACLKIEKV